MVKSNSRGWDIYHDGKDWRYSDNNEIFDDSRPCKRCGKHPTKKGKVTIPFHSRDLPVGTEKEIYKQA